MGTTCRLAEWCSGAEFSGGDGAHWSGFQFTQASFPGSIAVVRGEPKTVSASGVTTQLLHAADASDRFRRFTWRGNREVHGVFHGPVRAAVQEELSGGGDRGWDSEWLCGAGDYFSTAPKGMTQPVNMAAGRGTRWPGSGGDEAGFAGDTATIWGSRTGWREHSGDPCTWST